MFYLYFFLSFFLVIFLFISVFSLTDTNDSKDGAGKGIIIFLVFHFHPLTNIHLIYGDFYHSIYLFLLDLFIFTKLIVDETFSP